MKKRLIVRNLREFFESNVNNPFTHLATLEREIMISAHPDLEIEIQSTDGWILFCQTGMKVAEDGSLNYIYQFITAR
jgi:hypothetical protein